jgi:ankyrin repeat protein
MSKTGQVLACLMVFVCIAAWLVCTRVKAASQNQALCVAASKGDTVAVERLLRRGADPNAVGSIGNPDCNCEDNPSPAPALILAIYQTSGHHAEHLDTVVALVRAGADVNARADAGLTALMWASSPRMVKFLLAHGAQVNLRDDHGYTALDHQAGLAGQEIDRVLKQAGAIK